ncbi:SUN domain-containing protein 1 [Rhododendron vialii]|uniref:SUN domain-containing protein 1 n=1 Tax=Rhododendron vialii TaxID=182163 RepID=UPI00265FE116|nr:SUN domain-containing protein 1 [Rhododendron vialii]
MSASTVSITANPSARRRPVEKKSPVDILAPDAVAFATTTAAAEDRSHSISRDGVVERSRDAIQLKKTTLPPSATASGPTRGRTTRKTNPKPRWQTVLSVFTKNFLLLVVLLGFVQMIRKAVGPGSSSGSDNAVSFSAEDFEGRIAEVEKFLKTTTKMMQVQMDVVDRKIENEVLDLKTDLKRIEERREAFERELGKLDGRTEGLEKALGELRSTEWLSKQDLGLFFDELRKKNKGLGNGDLNLDEIRAVARGIVEKEIEKHAADGLGRVDYALSSAGATVVKHSEPYGVGKGKVWFYTANRNEVHHEANMMLRPSFGEPGQCFPLKGNNGFVEIKLRTAIIPEAITLEHVAKSVAYDRSSAPKDCRVSGWLEEHDSPEQQMFLLTEFTYDLEKSNAQTFNVLDSVGSGMVNTIRLDVASNHGSASYTCIYRLRVHGHEPDSVSLPATQS